jgi:GT2 family glycosyltransferase
MERMSSEPKIGIVTVLYNSGTVLGEYFESLDRQTFRNFVLYVIENHSPDDSLAVAERMAPKMSFPVVLIPEPENWGVAKGNNIGIARALADGCDYVLLSNNDTVLESTTIERLLEGLRAYGASMAVPKIYFHGTNQIWAAGGRFVYWKGLTAHIGSLDEDDGRCYEKPLFVSYSPTCFMLIRRDVFDRVGMMDEKYFVYYDDTDFVWRAVKDGNEKLIYIPSSRLWHKESTCTGGQLNDFVVKYMTRNHIYFIKKNLKFPQKQIVLMYKFLHSILRRPFTYTLHQQTIMREAEKEGRTLI